MSHAPREDAFIEVLRRAVGADRDELAGIGDDAAVLADTDGRVIACDTMVCGVHWDPALSDAYDVGAKLLASNVSDIYAMGARPTAMLLAATIGPAGLDVTRFAEGLRDARDRMAPGAALVGGDTTHGACTVLSLTVVGRAMHAPIGRFGARAGQTLWCDGPVGHAAAGLALLRRDRDARGALVDAHRRPTFVPPDVEGWPAAGVTAAIDISDGLSIDAWRMATASDVALVLNAPLPGAQALREAATACGVDAMQWQLAGGDDYVRLVAADRAPGPGFVPVGRVERGPASLTLIRPDDTPRRLTPDGYRHDPGLAGPAESGDVT